MKKKKAVILLIAVALVVLSLLTTIGECRRRRFGRRIRRLFRRRHRHRHHKKKKKRPPPPPPPKTIVKVEMRTVTATSIKTVKPCPNMNKPLLEKILSAVNTMKQPVMASYCARRPSSRCNRRRRSQTRRSPPIVMNPNISPPRVTVTVREDRSPAAQITVNIHNQGGGGSCSGGASGSAAPGFSPIQQAPMMQAAAQQQIQQALPPPPSAEEVKREVENQVKEEAAKNPGQPPEVISSRAAAAASAKMSSRMAAAATATASTAPVAQAVQSAIASNVQASMAPTPTQPIASKVASACGCSASSQSNPADLLDAMRKMIMQSAPCNKMPVRRATEREGDESCAGSPAMQVKGERLNVNTVLDDALNPSSRSQAVRSQVNDEGSVGHRGDRSLEDVMNAVDLGVSREAHDAPGVPETYL